MFDGWRAGELASRDFFFACLFTRQLRLALRCGPPQTHSILVDVQSLHRYCPEQPRERGSAKHISGSKPEFRHLRRLERPKYFRSAILQACQFFCQNEPFARALLACSGSEKSLIKAVGSFADCSILHQETSLTMLQLRLSEPIGRLIQIGALMIVTFSMRFQNSIQPIPYRAF